MAVTDEEFARQLWDHVWSKTGLEFGDDDVQWKDVSANVRQSYLDDIQFIRESEWFKNLQLDKYLRGYDDGIATVREEWP